MRTLALAIIAAIAFAQWGDMPVGWSKHGHSHTTRNAGVDVLYDLTGCRLLGEIYGGKSFQCEETFVYVGAAGKADLALGAIANVQVEGELVEARAVTANVGTRGAGAVGRGLLFEGSCYGAVAECVLLRGQGWELRAIEGRLELVGPDGTLRDVWR